MAVLAEGPLPSPQLAILSKGSDDVQCARCGDAGPAAAAAALRFARQGLRTLVVGRKNVARGAAEEAGLLGARGAGAEVAFESLERLASCLGVAALRDELQEGAPETIRALRSAGIKVCLI